MLVVADSRAYSGVESFERFAIFNFAPGIRP